MDRTLRFREDGTFTIVQFTDLHWQNGEPKDLRTRDLMEKVLRAEKPDLIVFTGDILYSPNCKDPRRSMRDVLSVAANSGIPWAAVFGNHDAERGATRRELMAVMRELPGCMAEPGPAEVHGVGNYRIRLNDGSGRTVAALFFLDSGDRSEIPAIPGYDWIRTSQIDWYLDQAEELAKTNGGAGVPSLAFFHIPLPEYAEAWRTRVCYGRRYEPVSSPKVNSGFFAAMSSRGSVLGTFCGHDHINDYGGNLLGTWLYYGRSSGYQAYGRWGFSRGARVIRLAAGKRSFKTWIRLHNGKTVHRPPVHRPWLHWLLERVRKWL
ncbi:metallophosphoesterase [Cohnella sp. CFH 77786]|uniref:metallophosphoesterase family protein n=1 Tax=Cohnella sp. CFH 77786 TaxID=2662265 RepID=UPI001C60A21F|nr:metallophosphoesterase family protein [Cohnella sp. CFH 77786]MBW5447983.1 metallophosphoesterase [Cohnella sp. CFH 77786]